MIDSIDSPYIIAATSNNFKPLVIENSKQGPVLVNFWSQKAGPSLRQYPVLDQIVHHYDGRLLLINVDADTEIEGRVEVDAADPGMLRHADPHPLAHREPDARAR